MNIMTLQNDLATKIDFHRFGYKDDSVIQDSVEKYIISLVINRFAELGIYHTPKKAIIRSFIK
jgi:hypothetical protein